MAEVNCSACEELRQEVPLLLCNGFDDNMCASLKNDTGLSASSGHNDCTDLNNMNDCLVGNLEAEVDAYEVCDWKEFVKTLIPNIWTMFKGIICAICGIWTNIHHILNEITKLWCWIDALSKPQSNATLYPDDPKVRFRKVSGVELRYDPQNPKPNDAPLTIRCIGSTAKVTGSLRFNGNMPSSYTGSGSRIQWLDFYKGQPNITNAGGRNSYDGNFPSGGVLLYEYEVKACDWGFTNLYDAPLVASEAGDFVARIKTSQDGDEYPYDYGWDANGRGQIYHPSSSAYDTLIQIRLNYVNSWGIAHSTGNVTPNGTAMVRPCTSRFGC